MILAPRKVLEKARVRRCVGDPPRQIEDPQSPPCVNYWEGDNGGATYKGITRDEIRIAFFSGGAPEKERNLLVNFFNRRFEFYGRKLRLLQGKGKGNLAEPEVQRALAAAVDEEVRAFASFSWLFVGAANTNDAPFLDELARRKIVGVASVPSFATERNNFSKFRPFQWNVMPALDELQVNIGQWMCQSLVGRRAVYGGPDVVSQTRAFGLLATKDAAGVPDTSALDESLAGCGSKVSNKVETSSADTAERRQAAVFSLRAAGVTSVMCFCGWREKDSLAQEAATGGYFPEWIMVPMGGQDLLGDAFADKTSREHSFGLFSRNKVNDLADTPWSWALKDADTNYKFPDTVWVESSFEFTYRVLLLLSSGIQMAGPNLTPQTFEQGLLNAKFPNPGSGGSPYYQARVGFGPSDHTMVSDLAMVWWDTSADNFETASGPAYKGAFCYVDRGARFGPGGWPGGEPRFFDRAAPCR